MRPSNHDVCKSVIAEVRRAFPDTAEGTLARVLLQPNARQTGSELFDAVAREVEARGFCRLSVGVDAETGLVNSLNTAKPGCEGLCVTIGEPETLEGVVNDLAPAIKQQVEPLRRRIATVEIDGTVLAVALGMVPGSAVTDAWSSDKFGVVELQVESPTLQEIDAGCAVPSVDLERLKQ